MVYEGNILKHISGCPDWCGSVGWVLSIDQKIASSIPGQGMCLGCGPGSWLGVCERQPIDVSLTHQYFPPFLSF